MDERYYILAGLGLLLVVLVIYFIVAYARYRSAVRRARASSVMTSANGEAKYLGPQAEHAEDLFAVPAGRTIPAPSAATVPAPPQAPFGVHDFDIPKVHSAAGVPAVSVSPSRVPAAVSAFEPEPDFEPDLDSVSATTGATVYHDAVSAAAIPFVSPATPTAPEPAPTPEPAPAPAPAPEPEPAPAPAPAPSLPGYSLADELERLMLAAEHSAPLLTPEEHEAVVAPSAPPVADEPLFGAAADPMFPPPSVGQVLSAAPAQLPLTPAVASEPVVEPAPEPAPIPARARPADVPEYRLVAPVELHFTVGEGRIGVKAGTRSFAEFQRLAGILLQDLRSVRGL